MNTGIIFLILEKYWKTINENNFFAIRNKKKFLMKKKEKKKSIKINENQ